MFKKFLKNITDNLSAQIENASEVHSEHTGNTNGPSQEQLDAMSKAAADIGTQKAESLGYSTFGNEKEDPNDPLLQPIHGIKLADYGAAAGVMGDGVTEDQICKALGVERPAWDEARRLWDKRMQEDGSFNVINVYTKYFGKYKEHEKLGNLVGEAPLVSDIDAAAGSDNVQRINDDEHYYYELCGARQAAYDAGMDGAQWILDNYGITISQFQAAATKWMSNFANVPVMMRYQEDKQKEYAERFAKESGGNIADDITF